MHMGNGVFETKVLGELGRIRKTLAELKEEFEGHILSEEEKARIDAALEDKKKGRLLGAKEVFG